MKFFNSAHWEILFSHSLEQRAQHDKVHNKAVLYHHMFRFYKKDITENFRDNAYFFKTVEIVSFSF